MRQIARRFGIDTLKSISELNKLTWVVPEEAKGDQQASTELFSVASLIHYMFLLLCPLLNPLFNCNEVAGVP